MIFQKPAIYYAKKLVQALVLLGMTYQLYQITALYLRYKVDTNLRIDIPAYIKTHSLSVCFYMSDQNEVLGQHSNPTIRQMLQNTPNASQLLDSIRILDAKRNKWYSDQFKASLRSNAKKSTSVDQHFRISKYVLDHQICYKFAPSDDSMLAVSDLASNILDGIVFRVNFISDIDTFTSGPTVLRPIIHSSAYPHKSYMFSRRVNKDDPSKGETKNHFHLSPQTLNLTFLKPPYETNCYDYSKEGFETRSECRNRCMNMQTIKLLQKVPANGICNESYDYPRLNQNDDRYSEQTARIKKFCEEKVCVRRSCHSLNTITKIHRVFAKTLTISHVIPHDFWFHIWCRPSMDLVEVITYAMGIVGTYTGLCVMRLNPISVLKRARTIQQLIIQVKVSDWRRSTQKRKGTSTGMKRSDELSPVET